MKAYGEQNNAFHRVQLCVDANSLTMQYQQLVKWWLTIRLEIIGGLVSSFIAALAIGKPNLYSAGYLALSLNGAFALVSSLKWLVGIMSDVEASMNSVERIKHYIDSLPPEESAEVASKYITVPDEWPKTGNIVANDVQMSYGEGPLVLKGLNFNIADSEHIGIVGRTGCGKSSLMVALFRIESLNKGSVLVDNIDISQIPLPILRKK